MKRKLSCLEKIGVGMICIFIPTFAIYAILNGFETQNESVKSESIPYSISREPAPEFDPITGENMEDVIQDLRIFSASLNHVRDVRESAMKAYDALATHDDATVYLTIQDSILPVLERYYKEVLYMDKLIDTKRVRVIYDKIRVGSMGLTLAIGQVKNSLSQRNEDLLTVAGANVEKSYEKIILAEKELAELIEKYVR